VRPGTQLMRTLAGQRALPKHMWYYSLSTSGTELPDPAAECAPIQPITRALHVRQCRATAPCCGVPPVLTGGRSVVAAHGADCFPVG